MTGARRIGVLQQSLQIIGFGGADSGEQRQPVLPEGDGAGQAAALAVGVT
jgi:hypothetical protein